MSHLNRQDSSDPTWMLQIVCYIHQCWLRVSIWGCVVKRQLRLVLSDYKMIHGTPSFTENLILLWRLCIWSWLGKKRAVVWEIPLFSRHLKSKLLHCGLCLDDQPLCEPSGSNGQSHRNWATRAVSAWRAHRPQGTFLSSGSCWEEKIFWFVFIAGNKYIYKTNNQETSLSSDVLKRRW